MNPKIKKLIIVMVVMMILVFGGIAVSMVMSNMNTVTISDFKILDANGEIMKDQNVYISEESSNNFKISVSIKANGSNGGYSIYSTNKNVANVIWKNNTYYVEYYNSGVASIVVQSRAVAGLRDSFKVYVHENYNVDLNFVDSTSPDKKTIDVFADGLDYNFKFDIIGTEEEYEQNSRLLKVVEKSNEDLFNKLEVDSNTNSLKVNVKRELNGNIVKDNNEYVIIQSYIRDSKGTLVVKDNYIIKINIIYNAIEDLQLELCDNYDFESDKTYVLSMINDEDRALSLINPEKEVLLRKVYVSEGVQEFFFKVRIVFSNKQVQYITHTCDDNTWVEEQSSLLNLQPHEYVSILTIPDSELSDTKITFTLSANNSPSREQVSRTFVFANMETNTTLDIDELYDKDEESGVYTYTYFDKRFKRFDTITDDKGNVIDFVDSTNGLTFTITYDSDGYITGYTSVAYSGV